MVRTECVEDWCCVFNSIIMYTYELSIKDIPFRAVSISKLALNGGNTLTQTE